MPKLGERQIIEKRTKGGNIRRARMYWMKCQTATLNVG